MALERYLHYYTRFNNHHNSLKFEIEAKSKMAAKIKEMETLGDNTWMDCLYLNEANEALHECRYALKFTYVFAFYLSSDGSFRDHFEMEQKMLEMQTEELAEHLEKGALAVWRRHRRVQSRTAFSHARTRFCRAPRTRAHASLRARTRLYLCRALSAARSLPRASLPLLSRRACALPLAEVADIQRMEVVHCFQMAKKRLRNLMEIVEAENSQWRREQQGGAGSSSDPLRVG